MTADFALREKLAAGVRDAAGAWRFIRQFAEVHAHPIVAADGCGDDELRTAEARLGFPLPASLHQVYALIGRRDDLTRVQDRLLTPAQLHIDDTGEVLVFRVENQNVAQWGVPLSAVGEPDPPVVFRLDSLLAERAWQPFLSRTSLACVEMVLSEWLLSSEVLADNRELDDDATAVLETRFSRLPLPDYPLWAEPTGRPVRWFGGAEAILRDDAGTWIWVRAASADALADVRKALPGEWFDDRRVVARGDSPEVAVIRRLPRWWLRGGRAR